MDEPQIEEQIAEKKKDFLLPASVLIAALIIAFAWIYTTGQKTTRFQKSAISTPNTGERGEENTAQAIELPVTWGNLGAQMVVSGVIDRPQLEALYAERGGLTAQEKELLGGRSNGALKVNHDNAGLILNLLWAAGLSNKNQILENGLMSDPRYGDPSGFASTGGWTIAKGNVMDHYSAHSFITLTNEQQQMVERVSKNIYRPCCDNATYFPDCNHGMAMLGLLELLASQGVSEEEMYRTALIMNSYWFPEQYATIARYFASKGQILSTINPKEILGSEYSSASGFRLIATLVPQVEREEGSGCGLEEQKQKSSGCGI